MRIVKSLRDAEIIIGSLLDRVERLETKTREKLVQEVTNVIQQDSTIESLDMNLNVDMNVVTHKLFHIFLSYLIGNGNLKLSSIIPELQLEYDAGTPSVIKCRVFASPTPTLALTNNLSYDGILWNLDDISKDGSLLTIRSINFEFFVATAGANPRTLTSVFKVDSGNRVYINGVAILNVQQSDPGAGPASPGQTTLGIGGSAGATYTSTEQSLINNLLTNNTNTNTNVYNLKVAVDALITCVNNIRTALRTHGLCA